MAELLSQILGPSGSLAVLFGSIYGAFAVCDANTSKQIKADYALVLKTGKYVTLINALLVHFTFENYSEKIGYLDGG